MSIRVTRWLILAVLAAAAAGVWWAWQARERTLPLPRGSVIKSWKGGESLVCTVTVDGAALTDFSAAYNIVMVCGVGRDDRDRRTDRAVTISDAAPIQPRDFEIEEAFSGPMRVLLEELTRRDRLSSAPDAARLHDERLWYELALLPKGIDALTVSSIADMERLGGRRLSNEPLWTVISVRP